MRQLRAALVAAARRHSRVAHEAEDLAHDLIVSGLRRGLALDGEAFLRSAHAAARRHAAFLARTAERRRARDVAAGAVASDAPASDVAGAAALSTLSPALRTTLLLLASGLDKAELLVALGLNDAALRKRFQSLRELSPIARPTISIAPRTPVITALRKSQVALLPSLTSAVGARAQRLVAVADPDGHGIIFALTSEDGTATSDVSPNNPGTPGLRC